MTILYSASTRSDHLKKINITLKENDNDDLLSQSTSSFDNDIDYWKSNVTNTENVKSNYARVEGATFFTLCRNSDLSGIKQSIKSMEERFNYNKNYPWVFANDEPFTEEFKTEISNIVSGDIIFTTIPSEYWDIPETINQRKMRKEMIKLVEMNTLYGDSVSYRQMCRFNSGFFYKLNALRKFNWYWRVEPDIKYTCDITGDPFKTMVEENKTYGFALAMTEDKKTIKTLWSTSREYFESPERWNNKLEESEYYDSMNDTSLAFIEQDSDKKELIRGKFNYCHYWSNFEIGNLNFYRNETYDNYFKFLDKTGNFFYERWGDAPVHTIAVSYLLTPDKIKYFDDTGYYHGKIGNCPRNRKVHKELNCSCRPYNEFSWKRWSCVPRWFAAFHMPFPQTIH